MRGRPPACPEPFCLLIANFALYIESASRDVAPGPSREHRRSEGSEGEGVGRGRERAPGGVPAWGTCVAAPARRPALRAAAALPLAADRLAGDGGGADAGGVRARAGAD